MLIFTAFVAAEENNCKDPEKAEKEAYKKYKN